MPPERDFPLGHPAAADYAGQPYTRPFNPSEQDFPETHPAHGGHNVSALDTPDGLRARLTSRAQDLSELAAIGALPPLKDPTTGEAITISPEQLAFIYRTRMGLRDALAEEITARYKLGAVVDSCTECGAPEANHPAESTHKFRPRKAEAPPALIDAKAQALAFIQSLGYLPEAAEAILAKYGVPEIMKDRDAALAH